MGIKMGKKRGDALSKLMPALIDQVISNEDLVTEILLRVPTKSLITLKGVCKYWLNLISHSKFCYNHSARSTKEVSTILCYCSHELMSISLHGRPSPKLSISGLAENGSKAYLEHSCNGLMLFSWDIRQRQYSVCNLTTQKSIIVPLADNCYKYNYLFSCLAFDPARSPFYKIVLIRSPTDCGSYQIDIFLSETKSWRHLELSTTSWSYPLKQKAYWDGSIHWLNFSDTHFEFDVDKEKLIETPFPKKPTILTVFETHFFGECNGNLLLVQYRTRTILGFRILEMKRGTRHLVVKLRVNLRPILDIHPDPWKYKFHVMSLVQGSRKNDLIVVLATGSKFLSFNLKTKVVEVLGDISTRQFESIAHHGSRFSYCTQQFFESLSPI